MSVQLNFDDLPLNTIPSNQYTQRGVTFTTSGPAVFNASAFGTSHHAIQSVRVGGSVEFPDRAISGHFTSSAHSHVGVSVGRTPTESDSGATLHVYNAADQEISSKYISIPSGRVFAFGEIFAPTANIASFTIERTADSDIFMDMLEFDSTADPHRPDFRLEYTGGEIFLKPGADALLEVKILRLFGSTGNITFQARGGPTGVVVTSITPEPVNELLHDTVFIRIMANWNAPSSVSGPTNKLFITGVPSPLAGDSPQIINVPVNVFQSYDAHIISMEVTQAIQTLDLPTKPSPSQSGDVEYKGVDLAAGCRTAVRVFGAFASLGAGGLLPILEISLHGENRRGTLPGSPLLPDSMNFLNAVATAMTPDIRTKNGTLFTLPPSWTRGVITLRAEITAVGLSFTPPMTFETNIANNAFTIRNVTFLDTEGQWVNPIVLKIAGTTPIPLFDPAGHETVFSGFRNTLPMDADKLHILDYQQTLDVTYQYLKNESDPLDRNANIIEALFNAIDDWGFTVAQRNFFIGIHTAGPIGGSNLLTRGTTQNPYFHWYDFYYNFVQQVLSHPRQISISSDFGRPLTEVAHELGHLCGRLHASPASRNESGVLLPTGAQSPTEDWPPDQLGFIQGVGFNKLDRTVLFPTADKPLFDFMSYAAQEWMGVSNAWISIRGWNETLKFLRPYEATHNPTPPSNPSGGSVVSSPQSLPLPVNLSGSGSLPQSLTHGAVQQPAVNVLARIASNGQVRSLKFSPVAKERQFTSGSDASEYSVVLRKVDNTTIEHAPVVGTPLSTEMPMYLQASIPIDSWDLVSKVEIWHKGTLISEMSRANKGPVTSNVVVNTSLAGGEAGSKEISWKSSHEDGLPLDVKIDYLLQGAEEKWKPIYATTVAATNSAQTFNTGALPARSFPYNPTARVRVHVSDGFNMTTTTSEPFQSEGAPPSVRVVSPKPLEKWRAGCNIYLQVDAFDDLGHRITDESLVTWTSGGKVVAMGATTSWQTSKTASGERVAVQAVVKDYRGRNASSVITFEL